MNAHFRVAAISLSRIYNSFNVFYSVNYCHFDLLRLRLISMAIENAFVPGLSARVHS